METNDEKYADSADDWNTGTEDEKGGEDVRVEKDDDANEVTLYNDNTSDSWCGNLFSSDNAFLTLTTLIIKPLKEFDLTTSGTELEREFETEGKDEL